MTFISRLAPNGVKAKPERHRKGSEIRLAPLYSVESLEQRVLLSTVNAWNSAVSGDFDNPAMWSLGHVPTASEDAVINVTGAITVTHNTSAADSINSLTSNQALTLSAGTLTVTTTIQVNNIFTLSGGAIVGATILAGTGGQGITLTSAGGTLTGVTCDGKMDLSQQENTYVYIYGGLVLNGTMLLGNAAGTSYGAVFFEDGPGPVGGLTGTGTVTFGDVTSATGGWNYIWDYANVGGVSSTLTIGPNITIGGQDGDIWGYYYYDWLINDGAINATVAKCNIGLESDGGSVTNNGTINLSAGTLTLGGNYTQAGLGIINRSGGTVQFFGSLNLGGGTFTLDATTGSWNLTGGTISDGTIDETDGDMLEFTNSGGGLSDVTFNGNMDLTEYQDTSVTVSGGLVLNGMMSLGNATGATYGRVVFQDDAVSAGNLSGAANVVFGGAAFGDNYIQDGSGSPGAAGAFTIGPSVIISGQIGEIYSGFGGIYSNLVYGTIINEGTINVAAADGEISFGVGSGSVANEGKINLTAGTLDLGGNYTLAGLGAINRTGGTVNFEGSLSLDGQTLSLSAATGPWNLVGGSISAGTVTESAGALLVFTSSGGGMTGVTFDGNMDLTEQQGLYAYIDIYGGLVLNGTMSLGNAAGTTYGVVSFEDGGSSISSFAGPGVGSLSGAGVVVFGGAANYRDLIQNHSQLLGAAGCLTIGSNITVEGQDGEIYISPNGTLVNDGTIRADGTAGTFKIGGSGANFFTNLGDLSALNGETLNLSTALTVNAPSVLTESASSSVLVAGSLLSNVTITSEFALAGAVTLDGSGTTAAPQLLEAMSEDLGSTASAFINNFAIGLLALANNTYVQLVDQSSNSPGAAPEAVYADSISIPIGATLNLNGLHVYTRQLQLGGTTVNGTIAVIPASGPVVAFNPISQTLIVGEDASFSAAASGNPVPTVQWMVETPGNNTFSQISGATSATLDLGAATLLQSGNQYEAIFHNGSGPDATTTPATLTVNPAPAAPAITLNPASTTLTVGQNASFTAAASGYPTPTVQWMVENPGSTTFAPINGATSATLALGPAILSETGNRYEAVFHNGSGPDATTMAAALTVLAAGTPVVTVNPMSQTANAGKNVTFTGAATGSPTPTVQWQISYNGGTTFANISGATSLAYTFATTSSQNGARYRATFKSTKGTVTTSAAILTVLFAPTISKQPASARVNAGSTVSFTVDATGNPTPTLQWQVSSNGGKTWTNISGATLPTYSFTATLSANGHKYRAILTNARGTATTVAAALTVAALVGPTVTKQPVSQSIAHGKSVTFAATASGNPSPTMQWEISANGGATWTNITGATSVNYSFITTTAETGHKYRAVFTNSVAVAMTSAATLKVT